MRVPVCIKDQPGLWPHFFLLVFVLENIALGNFIKCQIFNFFISGRKSPLNHVHSNHVDAERLQCIVEYGLVESYKVGL